MSDITSTIRLRITVDEAQQALQEIKQVDTEVRQQIQETQKVATFSYTKIIFALSLVQTLTIDAIELMFGGISATHRALITSAFQMAQFTAFAAAAQGATGNLPYAAALLIVSNTIAIRAAQLQDEGHREIAGELNMIKSRFSTIATGVRFGYLGG